MQHLFQDEYEEILKILKFKNIINLKNTLKPLNTIKLYEVVASVVLDLNISCFFKMLKKQATRVFH